VQLQAEGFTTDSGIQLPPTSGRRHLIWWVIGGVGLLSILGAAVWLWRRKRGT
jgi:LPXTG-motif cell wall-anchored protein